MKAKPVDLLRIGVFLIGVSMLLISFIILHYYIRSLGHDTWKPPAFHAYCNSNDGNIVISAEKTVSNITVKNSTGYVFCKINEIKAGSDEICFVGKNVTGTFLIETPDIKKVVECNKIYAFPSRVD